MAERLICVGVAVSATLDTIKQIQGLASELQDREVGNPAQAILNCDTDPDEAASEKATASGHLLPLGQVKMVTQSSLVLKYLHLKKAKQNFLLRWNLSCLSEQHGLVFMSLFCVLFYSASAVTQLLVNLNEVFTSRSTFLCTLVKWLPISALARGSLAQHYAQLTAQKAIDCQYTQMAYTFASICAASTTLQVVKVIFEFAIDCSGWQSDADSQCGFTDQSHFDYPWTQFQLMVFLSSLKVIKMNAANYVSSLMTLSENDHNQTIVNRIADHLFYEGGPESKVGYATLKLTDEFARFNLRRFNNVFKEQLSAQSLASQGRGTSERSDELLRIESQSEVEDQASDEPAPLGQEELSEGQRLANALSLMESPASFVKEGRGQTASFPELLFDAISDHMQTSVTSKQGDPRVILKRVFMPSKASTIDLIAMGKRGAEKRLEITVQVLCYRSNTYLLKVEEQQAPTLKSPLKFRQDLDVPMQERTKPIKKVSFDNIRNSQSSRILLMSDLAPKQAQKIYKNRSMSSSKLPYHHQKGTLLSPAKIGTRSRKMKRAKSITKQLKVQITFPEETKEKVNDQSLEIEIIDADVVGPESESQQTDQNLSYPTIELSRAQPQSSASNEQQVDAMSASYSCRPALNEDDYNISYDMDHQNKSIILFESKRRYSVSGFDRGSMTQHPLKFEPENSLNLHRFKTIRQRSQKNSSFSRLVPNMASTLSPSGPQTSFFSGKRSCLNPANKGSEQSISRRSSSATSQSKGASQQLFVYKIIHDLRHPTSALAQTLEDLLQGQRDNFQIAKKFFTKNWRYKKDKRLNKALQQCKTIIERFQPSPNAKFSDKDLIPLDGALRTTPVARGVTEIDKNFFESNTLSQYSCTGSLSDELISNMSGSGQGSAKSSSSKSSSALEEEDKPSKVDSPLKLLKQLQMDIKAEPKPRRMRSKSLVFEAQPLPQPIELNKLSFNLGKLRDAFWSTPVDNFVQFEQNKWKKKAPAARVLSGEAALLPEAKQTWSIQPYKKQISQEQSKIAKLEEQKGYNRYQSATFNQRRKNFKVPPIDVKYQSNSVAKYSLNSELEDFNLAIPSYRGSQARSCGSAGKSKDSRSHLKVPYTPSVTESDKFIERKQINYKLPEIILVLVADRKKLLSQLRSSFRKNLRVKKQIKAMLSQAQMSLSLLKDLMNQAQMKNNTFTMENEYFDLIGLLKRSVRMMSTQARDRNVHVKGPVLSEPSDHVYFRSIYGDQRRYLQISLNFLTNAIKFTKPNGIVSVHLEVVNLIENKSNFSQMSSQTPDGLIESGSGSDQVITPKSGQDSNRQQLALTVSPERTQKAKVQFKIIFKDTGVGIEEADLQRLFSNFAKAEKSKKMNKQGVGLGLSICREIIMSNGGQVHVESQVGKGTDFIIDLTAKCKFDPTAHSEKTSEAHASHSSQGEEDDGLALDEQASQSSSISFEDELLDDVLSRVTEETHEQLFDKSAGRTSNHISGDSHSPRIPSCKSYDSLYRRRLRKKRSILTTPSRGSPPVKHAQKLQSSDVFKRQPKCLLANDNSFLLHFFKQQIASHDVEVDTAEDGLQALNLVKSQPIDHYSFIILDINMPEMDGFEACAAIGEYFASAAPVAPPPQKESTQIIIPDAAAKPGGVRYLSIQRVSGDFERSEPASQLLHMNKGLHQNDLNKERSQSLQKAQSGQIQEESKGDYLVGHQILIKPFIYALTADVHPELANKCKTAGFQTQFDMLNEDNIELMLVAAGFDSNKLQKLGTPVSASKSKLNYAGSPLPSVLKRDTSHSEEGQIPPSE